MFVTIIMIDGSINIYLSWALNFRDHVLLKGTVKYIETF